MIIDNRQNELMFRWISWLLELVTIMLGIHPFLKIPLDLPNISFFLIRRFVIHPRAQ